MTSDLYLPIKAIHVACVVLSGGLFTARGVLSICGSAYTNHRVLRRSPAIDSTLLGAALMLASIIHQWPFVQTWPTAKVLLLIVYISLDACAAAWQDGPCAPCASHRHSLSTAPSSPSR